MSRRLVAICAAIVLIVGPVGDVRAVDGEFDLRLQEELRFRGDFGLNSDPAFVTQLMSDPAAYDGGYGAALTPDELADLQRRLAMEDAAIPLLDHARALPTYAGHWIDQRAGGVFKIALAGDAGQHRASIEALTPAGSALQVVEVRYSWAELEAVRERVRLDRIALREEGIRIRELGIDPVSNRVEIAISALNDAAVAELHARFGDAILVEQSGNPTPTACTDRYNCIGPPVRAGIAAGPGCSLAFLVKKSGVYGTQWLTAGHCAGTIGATWQHDGVTIGWIRATCWPNCLYSDAARGGELNNTYASYHVYRLPTSMTPVSSVQSLSASYPGVQTCLNGRREVDDVGWRCGVVDEIRDVEYGDVYFLEMRYATYSAYNGDSGGAVHSPYLYTNPGSVRAHGVQSGCEDFTPPPQGVAGCETWEVNGRGIYSHIAHVVTELGPGLTVCSSLSPCP